jgi:hypothetical protein
VEDSDLPPDLHVGTKHLLPATPPSSEGAKRRKVHALQYVNHTVPLSKSDDKPMDPVPAFAASPGYLSARSILDTTSDAYSVP